MARGHVVVRAVADRGRRRRPGDVGRAARRRARVAVRSVPVAVRGTAAGVAVGGRVRRASTPRSSPSSTAWSSAWPAHRSGPWARSSTRLCCRSTTCTSGRRYQRRGVGHALLAAAAPGVRRARSAPTTSACNVLPAAPRGEPVLRQDRVHADGRAPRRAPSRPCVGAWGRTAWSAAAAPVFLARVGRTRRGRCRSDARQLRAQPSSQLCLSAGHGVAQQAGDPGTCTHGAPSSSVTTTSHVASVRPSCTGVATPVTRPARAARWWRGVDLDADRDPLAARRARRAERPEGLGEDHARRRRAAGRTAGCCPRPAS